MFKVREMTCTSELSSSSEGALNYEYSHKRKNAAAGESEEENGDELSEELVQLTSLRQKYNSRTISLQQPGHDLIQLPESVYGLIITLHFLVAGQVAGAQCCGCLCVTVYMVWVLTLAGQAVFIYFLESSVKLTLPETCEDNSHPLRLAALLVFVTYMVGDIMQTFELHLWLDRFRDSDRLEALEVVAVSECNGDVVSEDCGCAEQEQDDSVIPVSGIPPGWRLWFYMTSVIPKLVSTIGVLICASGVILRAADDFNLILSVFSAIFIADIDDIAYKVLVPRRLKVVQAKVPPLNYSVEIPEMEGRCGGVKACVKLALGMRSDWWFLPASVIILTISFVLYFAVWCRIE